jgi:ATP-dependent HslUV protease subunit HslV
VSDPEITILVDGSGNCIEIEDGLVAVGSGGLFAHCKFVSYSKAAAKALLDIDGMSARDIAFKAMKIASDLCVFTNDTFSVETLKKPSAEKTDNK